MTGVKTPADRARDMLLVQTVAVRHCLDPNDPEAEDEFLLGVFQREIEEAERAARLDEVERALSSVVNLMKSVRTVAEGTDNARFAFAKALGHGEAALALRHRIKELKHGG